MNIAVDADTGADSDANADTNASSMFVLYFVELTWY